MYDKPMCDMGHACYRLMLRSSVHYYINRNVKNTSRRFKP